MLVSQWDDLGHRMEKPSATEILAIRSILKGHDVIVNAQPSTISIPILQQVNDVIIYFQWLNITLPAGHVGSIYTGPYPCSDSRAGPGYSKRHIGDRKAHGGGVPFLGWWYEYSPGYSIGWTRRSYSCWDCLIWLTGERSEQTTSGWSVSTERITCYLSDSGKELLVKDSMERSMVVSGVYNFVCRPWSLLVSIYAN